MLPRPKRSGGPRTEAGKSAVAHNATKSGAYASLLVLPTENASEYEELQQQFFRDFLPQDIAESAMVKELATITWKRMRLEKFEHAHLLHILQRPILDSELIGHNCPTEVAESIELLHEPMTYTPEVKDRYVTYREHALQVVNQSLDITPDQIIALERDVPPLMEWIKQAAVDLQMDCGDRSGWHQLRVMQEGREIDLVRMAARTFVEHCGRVIWACDHQQELVDLGRAIREQRLLPLLQSPHTQRASEDLSRAFFRTLNELRKHQSWRREQSTVVLDPKLSTTDHGSQ